MSIIGSELLLSAADEGGFQIERSLRFNSSDSACLTATRSAGNTKTWTWSAWVKRSSSGSVQGLYGTGYNNTNRAHITFNSNDDLEIFNYASVQLNTSRLFRDVSAWYHIVYALDTTQATDSNRIKLYVNGVQETSFSAIAWPSLNQDLLFNGIQPHVIGAQQRTSLLYFYGGYLAEVHFIDGQALDPTSFGEFDDNNAWQPIAYSGSYGTNGFYLNFSDNSSVSALGTDSSGNGNNWTPNNFSVTAGSGNDSLLDSPTNGTQTDTGAGGEVSGNYCTLNSTEKYTGWSFANGNLESTLVTTASPATGKCKGTLSVDSGKWYWELTFTNTNGGFGVKAITYDVDENAGGVFYRPDNGNVYENGGVQATYATASVGQVIGIALNIDSNQISWYKNGTLLGTHTYGTLSQSNPLAPWFFTQFGNYVVNFGQRAFSYTAPSGYKCLCTANLPDPAIADATTVMDMVNYNGNTSVNTISGLNFSPDLVWIKNRPYSFYGHHLYDTVRGVSRKLASDETSAELYSANDLLTSFNSDGFTLTYTTGASNGINTQVDNIAWCWDAGSSTVTNTDGSITSQVRANPSTGFSIVTYTGTSSTATVGHGLGVAPDVVLCKRRNSSIYWSVYHKYAGTTGYLQLNSDAAYNSATMWNPVPTSSVLNFDNNGFGANNASGGTYVAYCFSQVEGFSSFGRATGNGNIDGVNVHLGFRPAFVIWKRSSSTSNWYMFDNERIGYNIENYSLQANSTAAENTSDILDFYANGFKLRTNDSILNGSGNTYIYLAFAENPFKYARAR